MDFSQNKLEARCCLMAKLAWHAQVEETEAENMQEDRGGFEVMMTGQKIFGRRGLDMRSVRCVVLRIEGVKVTVRCKARIILKTSVLDNSTDVEQTHYYTVPTNDTTTAVKPAVLPYGLLSLLIVLWRISRKKCRASAAGFVIHYDKS